MDFDALLPVDQDIYFPPGLFRLSEDEVFIDCGAYDGDTIRDLLDASGGRFRRVYAFEADGRNFLKLRQYIDSLPASLRERIKPIGKAVGERAEMLRFAATGTAAAAVVTGGSASSTGVDVPCVALDTEVAEPPTFIKMDIEGSELAALRGARRMIAGHAPILSICVYHTQDHLWAVPLQIAGVNPSYNLHLRPHLRESWDLVCYAVPAGRVPA